MNTIMTGSNISTMVVVVAKHHRQWTVVVKQNIIVSCIVATTHGVVYSQIDRYI